MRKRSLARERALQFLYQVDLRKDELGDSLQEFFANVEDPAEVREFATHLITNCIDHMDEINTGIESAAENWTMTRMAVVDRNILRLAAYELMFEPDIPSVVSINEAIDLAKKYSTEQSGSFVNGILDRIRSICGKK